MTQTAADPGNGLKTTSFFNTFHMPGVLICQKPDFFFHSFLFFPQNVTRSIRHCSFIICWNFYFRISWPHDTTCFSGPDGAARLLLLEISIQTANSSSLKECLRCADIQVHQSNPRAIIPGLPVDRDSCSVNYLASHTTTKSF